eukprot:CAMPEP_0204319730 /NCGR_PEP_ID=MMETSP0469-20131031/7257_1 /ASSEMBLY_ACC=CAM_ASM_000384 /TAXON_ID=2969 /ORGANISM="Oxyrrhis marina" /LENGTH=673 /DNA_ID=CAMNT_0051300935 /DNA_START=29 /DNA_END=2050 /DNA_ORIENTATION=-
MERTPELVISAEELQVKVEHDVREEASLMFKAMEEEIEDMRAFYEKREQALTLTMSNGVRALQMDLSESQSRCHAEAETAASLRQELASVKSTASAMRQELDSLRDTVKVSAAELQVLKAVRADLSEANSEVAQLRLADEESRRSLELQWEKVKQLEAAVAEREQAVRDVDSTVRQLQSTLETTKTELHGTQADLTLKESQVRELLQCNIQLEEDLKRSRVQAAELKEAASMSESKLDVATAAAAAERDRAEKESREGQALKSAMEDIKSIASSRDEVITTLERENKVAKERQEEMAKELESLQQKLSERSTKVTQQQEQIDALQQAVDAKGSQAQVLNGLVADTKGVVASRNEVITTLEREKKVAKERQEEMAKELESLQQKLSERSTKITQQQEQIDALQPAVQAWKGVVEDVKGMVARRDEELATLEREKKVAKERQEEMAKELESLQQKMSERSTKVTQQREQIDALQQAADSKRLQQQDFDSTQAEMVMLQQQKSIRQLKKELAESQRETACLRASSEDWQALSARPAGPPAAQEHSVTSFISEQPAALGLPSVISLDPGSAEEQPSLLKTTYLHFDAATPTVHDAADVIARIEATATPPGAASSRPLFCNPISSPTLINPRATAKAPPSKSRPRSRSAKTQSENAPPQKKAKKVAEPKAGRGGRKVR